MPNEQGREWGDRELVEGLKAGDEFAVRHLLARHGDTLYGIASRVTENNEDAQEAVQDALIQALRAISEFRDESSLKTWLVRIVINSARMRRRTQSRHRKRELLSVEDHFSEDGMHLQPVAPWRDIPETAALSAEEREKVRAAILDLPEDYGLVIQLTDIEGLNVREAAEALEITLAAAKSRLHRGRLRLRDALAPYFQT